MGTAPIVSLQRVVAWQHASTNRRIFAGMVVVGGATLLTKVLAMAKDVVVASYFGRSDAIDAFFIAVAVPTFAISVVVGSLPAALVPVYLRVGARDGRVAACRLLSNIMVVTAGLVALLTLILVLGGPHVLRIAGATFVGEKLALTQRLYLLLVPAIVVANLSGVLGAILNAHERFALPAATPAFMSVMSIVFLVVAHHELGIYALALGLTAGYVLEFIVLTWSVHKRGLFAPPDRRVWQQRDVREVLGQYTPLLIGGAVMYSSPLIDQSMAASLGPGSVAALGYGSKVVAAGLGIGVTAVTTAIFPHFSQMVAVENWVGVRHTLRTYSRLVLAGSVPLVLVIVLFSNSIIQVVFEHGQFSASDTAVVGQVQAFFALQIPFYVLGMIGVRLLSAAGANRVLMWLGIGNFATNIVGNYVFMRLWGVAGIALATSLVYVIAASVAYYCVARRIDNLEAASSSRPT